MFSAASAREPVVVNAGDALDPAQELDHEARTPRDLKVHPPLGAGSGLGRAAERSVGRCRTGDPVGRRGRDRSEERIPAGPPGPALNPRAAPEHREGGATRPGG